MSKITQQRESREFQTLFRKPQHARAMWSQTVFDRYCAPAMEPPIITDDKGNLTPQSQVEQAVWNKLLAEFKELGLSRLPTDGEMMEACQAYYSRHNSSAYVARRDSMGAKPIDESKIVHQQYNPLEDLTDEELLVMEAALTTHRLTESTSESVNET